MMLDSEGHHEGHHHHHISDAGTSQGHMHDSHHLDRLHHHHQDIHIEHTPGGVSTLPDRSAISSRTGKVRTVTDRGTSSSAPVPECNANTAPVTNPSTSMSEDTTLPAGHRIATSNVAWGVGVPPTGRTNHTSTPMHVKGTGMVGAGTTSTLDGAPATTPAGLGPNTAPATSAAAVAAAVARGSVRPLTSILPSASNALANFVLLNAWGGGQAAVSQQMQQAMFQSSYGQPYFLGPTPFTGKNVQFSTGQVPARFRFGTLLGGRLLLTNRFISSSGPLMSLPPQLMQQLNPQALQAMCCNLSLSNPGVDHSTSSELHLKSSGQEQPAPQSTLMSPNELMLQYLVGAMPFQTLPASDLLDSRFFIRLEYPFHA
jgi:hypothetical protein